jgi:hypothetical protein
MKRLTWAVLLALTAAAAHPVSACEECKNAKTVAIGETRIVGDGVAYSWVKLDAAGKPLAVGVTLTESALAGLPENVPAGMKGMPDYRLALPKEAAVTPFDHIGLNWNPKGHEPAGIYDVPHFDFHFYLISRQERSRITATGADLARCDRRPAAEYLPAGYILAPGSEVPEMGAHWADPASPEFHGQRFTRTFLYGSYDGQVAFIEPMITKAYLETRPEETQPLKLPATFAKTGYYPTSYTVKYDPVRREYTVALGAMRSRVALAAVVSR